MLSFFGKQATNVFSNSTTVNDLQILKQNASCKHTIPPSKKDSTGIKPKLIEILSFSFCHDCAKLRKEKTVYNWYADVPRSFFQQKPNMRQNTEILSIATFEESTQLWLES